MPICLKCNNKFPNKKRIDGKIRCLNKRSYCTDCSPFGVNSRKQLTKINVVDGERICVICNARPVYKGTKCIYCMHKTLTARKRERLYKLVGTACWLCDYDRGLEGTPMLDFHHMNPKEKQFGISSREVLGYKWETVEKEVRKCALLCCRCHREVECGLVEQDMIENIYRLKWQEIGT